MTRPEIIRADTIDLQNRAAPSAKDHPHAPVPTSNGSLAPHQAETIREVAAETAEEQSRSPGVPWTSGEVGDLHQYADDLAAGINITLNGQRSADGGVTNNMQAVQQQDALAVAQNGGVSSHDMDDSSMDGDGDDGMDDDMMDKISSSPSIEDEDIDFEFVYALHTFVATVEGQANATKGDTMVLLDDSNSYWWLVRVVKDSSIGYLPAEHIETPTERLARLNKHRNIDLSATMLGDQAEKARNPFKSTIKRRKAKTVTFTAPTYVDYDVDYSTEEEDLEAEFFAQQQQQQQQAASQQANVEPEMEDETAKVEPLKPRSQQKEAAKPEAQKQEANGDVTAAGAKAASRTSEEIFETKSGDGPKKTSDGTVRDSFFKDDTVETKKITLTPNLLRDDTGPRSSSDSKELKQRPSLDKLDKDSLLVKDDKKKKDKKEKEKKPSAFRSLFSRKDKKRSADDDDDSFGKRSMDANGDGLEKEAEEEEPAAVTADKSNGPQRHPSKLQKQKQQPRVEPLVSSKAASIQPKDTGIDLASFLSTEEKAKSAADVPPASMRIVDPELQDFHSSPESSPQRASRDRSPETSGKAGQFSGPNVSAVAGQNSHTRPQQVTQAKSRVVLDDSDSDEEMVSAPAPAPQRPAPVPEEVQKQQQQQQPPPAQRPIPGAYPDSYLSTRTTASDLTERGVPVSAPPPQQRQERLSESPVEISPVTSNNPPPLMVDSSSQEEDRSSSRSTPSPELIDRDDGDRHGKQDSITTSTSATTTSTWNDANLRAFFDSGSDIRDLLVVVYDKTDVVPAGPDHPVAGTLFKEPNAKLAEITTQLDNMLGDWLARKQRLRGTF